MNFVFITLGWFPDNIGGAYRYIADMAEGLARRGHEVHAVFPSCSPPDQPRKNPSGAVLHRFQEGTGAFFQNWIGENSRAKDAVKRAAAACSKPPLIVLCHAFFAPVLNAVSAPAAFLFTGPWAREFRLAKSAARRSLPRRLLDACIALAMERLERGALAKSKRILTISQYYVDALPRWHGTAAARAANISGGVNLSAFQPVFDRPTARRKLGLADGDFLFLTLRRLDPRMGLTTLLEAFQRAARSHPRARLWLGGTGPQFAALEEQIMSSGLHNRVRLLGLVPDAELPALLSAADCFVMPSLDLEGLGLASLEALACGTPVVGSKAGATPEILRKLGSDLLFEAGSASSLAAKMESILDGRLPLPQRRDCRALVEREFTWEKPLQAMEECWRALVQQKP